MKEKIKITHMDSKNINVLLTHKAEEEKSSNVFIIKYIFIELKRDILDEAIKQLQEEFPSLTLCYVGNIRSLLENITSNCSNCKHFVIHHNYLINAFDNYYDMYSFLVGFAMALDIEIEIIKD